MKWANLWIKFGENGVKKIGLFESIIFFNRLGEKKTNLFFLSLPINVFYLKNSRRQKIDKNTEINELHKKCILVIDL